MHVTGDLAENGTTGSIDMHLQGEDSTGSITLSGQTVQIISTGGKVYAQTPAAFWSANGLPARADGGTLSVAASGTAYPLQIADTGDQDGTRALGEFGSKQPIAAPPSPLDLDQDGA